MTGRKAPLSRPVRQMRPPGTDHARWQASDRRANHRLFSTTPLFKLAFFPDAPVQYDGRVGTRKSATGSATGINNTIVLHRRVS